MRAWFVLCAHALNSVSPIGCCATSQHLRAALMESALLAKQCSESLTSNSLPAAVKATIRKKARSRSEEQFTRHDIARVRNEQFAADQKEDEARAQKKAAALAKLRASAGGPIAVLVNGKLTRQALPPGTLLTLAQYEEAACNSFAWTKDHILQQLRLRNEVREHRTEHEFEELSKLVPEVTSRTHALPLSGRKDALLKRLIAVLTAERNATQNARAGFLQEAGVGENDDGDIDMTDFIQMDDPELEIGAAPHADAAAADSGRASGQRESKRARKAKDDPNMMVYE